MNCVWNAPDGGNVMVDDPMLVLEGDKKKGKVAKRELLEKDIENAVCNYAKNRYNMKVEKFTSPSRRSVPDRLFTVPCKHPGGFMFFIEFKAPGKEATKTQACLLYTSPSPRD